MCAILALALHAVGLYDEGTFSATSAYSYTTSINFISVSVRSLSLSLSLSLCLAFLCACVCVSDTTAHSILSQVHAAQVSMYYLLLFYVGTKPFLGGFRPVSKFLCVKLIIFASFWCDSRPSCCFAFALFLMLQK